MAHDKPPNHPRFLKIQPNNSLPEALGTLGSQHLLRRTLSVGKGAEVQPQTLREIEIEKFMTHGSWRRSTAHLWGPHVEVKADRRQRGGRTWWTCPSAWVEGFGAPGLSPDWSTWTPKSGFWSTSWEVYLKGTEGKAPGARSSGHRGCWGRVTTGTHLCLWLCTCSREAEGQVQAPTSCLATQHGCWGTNIIKQFSWTLKSSQKKPPPDWK